MNAGHVSLVQKLKNLFVSPKGIIIEQQVIVPDVSFWQDDNSTPQGIDFLQMRDNGAKGVIIRAGQNTWVDPDFVTGWRNAKLAGLPRGLYWFYDSRKDPISQANLFYQQAKNDPPEMEWIVDYEESYGGNYGGWQNLKLFIEHLRGFGIPVNKIAIYTGYYYWRDHSPQSNPVNLSYFKQFPLWLPWYTSDPSRVLIPAPWTNFELLAWQFTSSGDGNAYGVESNAIDLNYWNLTPEGFDEKYGGADPPPVPLPGGKMKGLVIVGGINIRKSDGSLFGAQLQLGDVVYGDVYNDGRNKIEFIKIYRANGTIQELGQLCNAAIDNDGSPLVNWVLLTNEPEPGTEPPPPVVVKSYTVQIDFLEGDEIPSFVSVNGIKFIRG